MLDVEQGIRLIPDVAWWKHGTCRAVLDPKYKQLTDKRVPNADAYQMLAYCTALGLDRGYLVYAKDAGQTDRNHTIKKVGTQIHVRAVDVEAPAEQVLGQVQDLADAVAEASTAQHAVGVTGAGAP